MNKRIDLNVANQDSLFEKLDADYSECDPVAKFLFMILNMDGCWT